MGTSGARTTFATWRRHRFPTSPPAPPRPLGTRSAAMSASMQFMITNAMKKTLVEELEYKPEEVEVMRPEIAAELIDKRAKRPFGDRPMPDQWKRDYDGGGGGGGGGRGFGHGPVGDLLRSLFYMTLTAGFCVGVACGISGQARSAVGGVLRDARRDLRRMLKGKKRKKRRKKGSKTSSTHGRGAPVEQ